MRIKYLCQPIYFLVYKYVGGWRGRERGAVTPHRVQWTLISLHSTFA